MMRITARLDAAQASEPRLAALKPGDLIRHVPGKRAILHATLEGRSVLVRLNLTPENGATPREWDELQRLWPYMATGDLRTPEPILAAPETGIIVQEYVSGTPLLDLLNTLDPSTRCAWLPPAAAWLRKSTAMSEGWHDARPEGWIARAETAAQKQPFRELRVLEAGILDEMRRIAPRIATAPWRTAICHGDFHPNNLMADGTRLTGIDLGGSRRMPLLKDAARFAMHMGRRRLTLSGRTQFGVDSACLAAFAEAFGLSAFERTIVLPFFLAFEALIRVETTHLPAARIRRAERTYRALLNDLTGVGRQV